MALCQSIDLFRGSLDCGKITFATGSSLFVAITFHGRLRSGALLHVHAYSLNSERESLSARPVDLLRMRREGKLELLIIGVSQKHADGTESKQLTDFGFSANSGMEILCFEDRLIGRSSPWFVRVAECMYRPASRTFPFSPFSSPARRVMRRDGTFHLK